MRKIFLILAILCTVVFGLLDLRISFNIMNKIVGPTLAFLSFLLAPLVFALAPWIALIKWGTWTPLLIIYGGGILTIALFHLSKIEPE